MAINGATVFGEVATKADISEPAALAVLTEAARRSPEDREALFQWLEAQATTKEEEEEKAKAAKEESAGGVGKPGSTEPTNVEAAGTLSGKAKK